MPEPTKIPRPFADSGDKNSIPDSSGGLGFASWQEGFPAITGTPFSQGGVAPKRADFNGIFNALSLATLWQQQGGFYEYDATTDYEVGNVVEYSGDLYKCLVANGPSSAVKDPTDTTVWSKVMTAADAAALYLPLSGGTLTGELHQNVTPIIRQFHNIPKGGNPTSTLGAYLWIGGNSMSTGYPENCIGVIGHELYVGNTSCAFIKALRNVAGSTVNSTISAMVSANGDVFTGAPTPAATDNSTKIATTAFVNNLCCAYYKDLGDNYVMKLADFDKNNVLYHINSLATTPSNNCPPSPYNNGDFTLLGMREGNYRTLIGTTPRNSCFYYARFWSGTFSGWSVFLPDANNMQ